MKSKIIAIAAAAVTLAGCATPYQEMGMLGGVQATRIAADTVQISARGNGYTDPDLVQRYALRKAAESTLAAGYDLFQVAGQTDRSTRGQTSTAYASGNWSSAWGTSTTWQMLKPGQSMMVKLSKYPAAEPLPEGMFDAREVLKFIGGATSDRKDCKAVNGVVECVDV